MRRRVEYLAACCSALLFAAVAQAQGLRCHLRSYLGSLETSFAIDDACISGTWVFAAAGPSGLAVFDIADPESPVLVGMWDTPSYARAISVVGSLGYVAGHTDGLWVFDLSNPTQPTPLGVFDAIEFARDVWAQGTIVYIADPSTDELIVVDAADPNAPTLLSRTPCAANPFDLSVSDSLAAVLCESIPRRVELYDVWDPAQPVLLSDYRNTGTLGAVYLDSQLLFVGRDGHGVDIVDVSIPQSPELIAQIASPQSINSILVRDGICYIGGSSETVLVNITTPASPRVVSTLGGPVFRVDVSEQLMFTSERAVGGYFIHLFDITDPAPAPILGEFDTGHSVSSSDLAGTTLLAGHLPNTVTFLDVSDPAAVEPLATYTLPNSPRAIRVVGSTAYVAAGGGGLQILDITDPAHPALVGGYVPPRFIWSVDVEDGLACVIDDTGLETLDVSNPLFTRRLGRLNIFSSPKDVRVRGGFAYVTDSTKELRVYDLSDPANPSLVLEWDEPNESSERLVIGDELAVMSVVGSGYHRLLLLDLSTPPEPEVVASFAAAVPPSVYSLDGDSLVLGRSSTNNSLRVELIDISDPAAPRSGGSWGIMDADNGVHVDGDVAYILGFNTGVAVNLTDCPTCPADLTGDGTINTQDFIAFLAAWAAGEPLADWNEDGLINTQDFIAYLTAWAAGC